MLSVNPNTALPPAIFLMGPTASGKTDLAVALSLQLPCDILSVDSALVYHSMNIGTAKPDEETLARAPHRLISFLDPSVPYSAAQFRTDALREMAAITAVGRIPLLVGGTMLYFKVLMEGIADLPASDPVIRARLLGEAEQQGWPAMHARLERIDPVSAARLHPNHSQRILRALEVHAVAGVPLSELQKSTPAETFPYRAIQLALAPTDRNALYNRIEQRFDRMLENDFVGEVRQLYQRGDLSTDLPAIRAVGYRQVWDFLEGHVSASDMRANGIAATRQLAKRQLTWLRSWPGLNMIPTGEPFDLKKVTEDTLKAVAAAGI